MKTDIHFWSYLAQFYLEWETFQTEVVEKIKACRFLFNNFLFRKSCCLWDNVEKYCAAGQAADVIWRMRIACWIKKAVITHSEYVIFIAFPL